MEYKRVLAILGVVMVSLGSAMAIWPTFFGGFTGWAVTEGVERLCRQYEEVKMSLVRLNGSMNLGVGVMALVVRDVTDRLTALPPTLFFWSLRDRRKLRVFFFRKKVRLSISTTYSDANSVDSRAVPSRY